MHELMIIVAPNGARRTKADHPNLPLSFEELAREAARCEESGASMIHLHVRDRNGRHSIDPDLYRTAIAAIRRETSTDFIIQITTEAVGIYSPQQQMATVCDVRPEAFSVAIRELIPDEGHEAAAAAFFDQQVKQDVLMQYILYDAADVRRFCILIQRGIVPDRYASVLFVLGRYATQQQSDPREVLPFLENWNLLLPWFLCAFGSREAACAMAAATLGGHVRVGFENNLLLPNGMSAPDNSALVRRIRDPAATIGISTATPVRARHILRYGK